MIHHIGRRTPVFQFISHEIHVRSHVLEIPVVSGAQIVQARFSVSRYRKPVFRALSVAGKEIFAHTALRRQFLKFVIAEFLLSVAVHHFYQGVGSDIAKFVLRENEMVAGIDIAVILHHSCMSASLCHTAYSGLLSDPVGQSGIKNLNKIPPYIIAHPFIKNGA